MSQPKTGYIGSWRNITCPDCGTAIPEFGWRISINGLRFCSVQCYLTYNKQLENTGIEVRLYTGAKGRKCPFCSVYDVTEEAYVKNGYAEAIVHCCTRGMCRERARYMALEWCKKTRSPTDERSCILRP
jgi:hypothetical protein